MQLFSHHLLSVILFTPSIGALVLLLLPAGQVTLQRAVANGTGLLGFVECLFLLHYFPTGYEKFTFQESVEWIPSIGARYSLGIDGISLLLLLLTSFLGMLAVITSWRDIQTRTKEYYIFLLLLQTGMLGVFVSMDFFLFYTFWVITLVPAYLLIGVWGSDHKLYAALKFVLYTLAGSVVMLLAILALYFNASKIAGAQSFDISMLLGLAQHFPDPLRIWIFAGFFFAFAVKTPLFPFHTWMPDAHAEAPTAVSILLAGVFLKMGSYGFLRFALPLLPFDSQLRSKTVGIVVVLSIVGIVYGAIVCLMQKDMKRLIAYSSLSQMGLCTLGIFALVPNGLSGSILLQLNHGIVTAALFLIFGILYERRHRRLISEFGGLAAPMPHLATIYFLISLSCLGMPLLGGFIGEFSILQGVFVVNKSWAVWSALGIVLSAAYWLWLYQRTMLGPVTHETNKAIPDINLREFAVLLSLLALTLWIGIYPRPFFDYINGPVDRIVREINPSFYQLAPAALPASTGEGN
jgi:NADH-quinone oxidoreductase subunit M